MSLKIQSNDPGHELVSKSKDSQRKQDSDDFTNLTYFMSCFSEKDGEMYQKSWRTSTAIVFANEPFCFWTRFGIVAARERFNISMCVLPLHQRYILRTLSSK